MTPSDIGSSSRAGFSTMQYWLGHDAPWTVALTKRFARPVPLKEFPIVTPSILVFVPPIHARKAKSPPTLVHEADPELQLEVYFRLLMKEKRRKIHPPIPLKDQQKYTE